jgi:hypothetical protein
MKVCVCVCVCVCVEGEGGHEGDTNTLQPYSHHPRLHPRTIPRERVAGELTL